MSLINVQHRTCSRASVIRENAERYHGPKEQRSPPTKRRDRSANKSIRGRSVANGNVRDGARCFAWTPPKSDPWEKLEKNDHLIYCLHSRLKLKYVIAFERFDRTRLVHPAYGQWLGESWLINNISNNTRGFWNHIICQENILLRSGAAPYFNVFLPRKTKTSFHIFFCTFFISR